MGNKIRDKNCALMEDKSDTSTNTFWCGKAYLKLSLWLLYFSCCFVKGTSSHGYQPLRINYYANGYNRYRTNSNYGYYYNSNSYSKYHQPYYAGRGYVAAQHSKQELKASSSYISHAASLNTSHNTVGNDADISKPFSDTFNIASQADIWTNATCGESSPENYCRLVQHVHQRLPEQIQCGVCDASSSDPDQRHPVTNAIDGSNRWWQSPTITNGKKYNWVTLTLDLKQTYQVAYVIVKAANSPRPGNWVLERSLDGSHFEPWQYFAETDSDCYNTYGIKASRGSHVSSTRDDQVHCTSYYSQLNPLENGEILVSLVNGRPGENGPSQELLDFTTARYVRLRLQKIRTLLGDLMTFVYNNPRDLDPSVTDRYYYSIKDISIGGQCICDGKPSYCVIDPRTGKYGCDCGANTCGENCDKCCPLFNQKPPVRDEVTGRVLCEECNCHNHADACVYNETVAQLGLSVNVYGEYTGGGICLECKHHTMGINCEMCIDGYFRPSGIDPRSPDSCIPCGCDYVGSTGSCIKDDSRVGEGLYAGDCICKDGYCGPNCDQCSLGYTGYPYCVPCACNAAGSINVNPCYGNCWCKTHVCGMFCDECRRGYYNLQADNPDGCDRCFCFGASDECYSSNWGAERLTSLSDWKVTDFVGSGHMLPSYTNQGALFVTSEQARGHSLNRALYWEAPEEFIGDKIMSYGGVFEFMFSYKADAVGPDKEPYLANYDVILQGSDIVIGHSGQYYEEDEKHHVTFLFTESGWRHMDGSTSPGGTLVPKEEFLVVLANIKRMLIRASYHMRQTESYLHGVSMEIAIPDSDGPIMSAVEICVCPEGYAGSSCEQCAPGYMRVGNILLGGTCEPCQCNGHSDECDYLTGECYNCEHNTMGKHCELCMGGYSVDESGECHACSCPLDMPSNNFADECISTSDGFSCSCRPGYEGEKCDRCALGYYGDPMVPGDFCKPCNCHGNADDTLCDSITGQCYGCQGDTEGRFCEQCQEGFFGSAISGDCKHCECNIYGTTPGGTCNSQTGQCECKALYTRRDCGQCISGYGNIALGCVPCHCNIEGSDASLCDPVTGQCLCKPGVGGVDCGKCLPHYYGFSPTGCQACNCSRKGSQSLDCDGYTGECDCKSGVVGRSCDSCAADHWGMHLGEGCSPCNCDPVGSESLQCDSKTGQCMCRQGVTGLTCDQCVPGFYGFSYYGCRQCQLCPNPAQICDPESGRCSCPPNTAQPDCTRCLPGAWGFDPRTGCKECGCDVDGSEMDQCDGKTGQCLCKDLYTSKKCNQCYYGYFGFPNCEYCGCDIIGTRTDQCDSRGLCQCDSSGQCPCRDNVEGTKCERCKDDAFSLHLGNPRGCTSCFCSGRTNQCSQAPYKWAKVKVQNQEFDVRVEDLSFEDGIRPNSQGVLALPAGSNVILFNDSDKPIYWDVPKYLLGDMTLSYNGALRFSIDNNEKRNAPFSQESPYPELYLLGNYVLRLVYSPPIENQSSRRHIKLHEDYWKTEAGEKVDRKTFMVALTNVQSLLIKLADNATDYTYRLHTVNIERAEEAVSGDPNLALGIEQCVCPTAYVGLSCQDPADGYYRVRPEPGEIGLINIEVLIGFAEPCDCNQHAGVCDRETGVCIDCSHNTTGKHCEVCIPGYYGNPTRGSPDDCQKCDCGFSANATCSLSTDGLVDFVCHNCPHGTAGPKCDVCAPGYYGDPSVIDGCLDCGCNTQGAFSIACDPVTGQCPCFPGILGQRCDECAPRYAVVDGSCESCLEGCTGLLFESIDRIQQDFIDLNLTEDQLLPWQKMLHLEKVIANLSKIEIVKLDDLPDLSVLVEDTEDLRAHSNELAAKAHISLSSSERVRVDGEELRDAAEGLLGNLGGNIRDLKKFVQDVVEQLANRLGEFDLDDALREAENILGELKSRNFTLDHIQVDRDRRLSEALLERVKMFVMDHTLDTETPASVVADLHVILDDLLKYASETNNKTSQALVKNKDNKAKISRIQETLRLLKERETDIRKTLKESGELLEETGGMINDTIETNEEIESIGQQLKFDQFAIAAKVERLASGNDAVQGRVDEAVDHADALADVADSLEAQFADTRQEARDPVDAAKSFERMVDAVRSAEDALAEAQAAVRNATGLVMEGERGSIRERAAAALAVSEKLNYRANVLKNESADLLPKLETQKEKLGKIGKDIGEGNQRLKELHSGLDNTGIDISDEVAQVKYKAASTIARSGDVTNRAKRIADVAKNEMSEKLDSMQKVNMAEIDEANAQVRKVRENFRSVKNLTDLLTDKAADIRELANGIQYNLEQLKDKIDQAREQANSIRTSLSHRDSCYRRYESELEPSTKNEIKLHFRLNDALKDDMLLFLLSNPNKGDFLALEVMGGKVRFSWDAGTGAAYVEHPEPIRFQFGVQNEADLWYEVTAVRVAKVGRLSVRKLSSPMPGWKNQTAESSNIMLDIDAGSDLFIGGVPGDYLLPGHVDATTFTGCIGDVSLNGKPIGLYNFRDLVGGGCDGCSPVPVPPPTEIDVFSFDGYGYATMPQVKYNAKRFFVEFSFKTFWEEALLFFTNNPYNGDFVSIELLKGRVVFKYSFEGKSTAVLSTISKYNTNTWVSVIAKRVDASGSMRVDQEEVPQVTIDDLGKDGLDLKHSTLNFAGAPLSTLRYARALNVTTKSFYGCLKGILISSSGPFSQELSSGLFKGMKQGCPDQTAYIVGFEGTGYLEMPTWDLDKNADVSFSFQTKQPDALLLLAKGNGPNAFYSVSLDNGHIVMFINGGRGLREIESQKQYNDDKVHTVTLVKSNRWVEMYVDDVEEGTARLASGDARIAALRKVNGGGLFLGGVPTGEDASGMAASLVSLIGCIFDVVIDDRLLAFDSAVGFYAADVGRCRGEHLVAGVAETTPVPFFTVTVRRPEPLTTTMSSTISSPTTLAPLPTECATVGAYSYYSDTVAFGGVKRSHVSVTVKRRSINKDFTVALEFRTFYPRGLMLYMANADQSEYIAIEMILGKIIVSYEGKNLEKELASEGTLNDGLWHHMQITKVEKEILIQVNGEEPKREEIARRLNVNATLHVGGLPERYDPREGLIPESFKGCMRNFDLNGEKVNLADAKTIMGTNSCYMHVEKGAYFDGWGYAVFAENYKIGSDYSIKLDFKTAKSDGVLVSISHNMFSAMSLELHNGTLLFTAINVGGRFTASSEECEFCLCDNRWHSVSADLIKNIVTLQVDGKKMVVGKSPGYERFLNTNAALYIGGFPVHAMPQKATSTYDFFVGCMRDLVMNGTESSWHDMDSIVDVHVSACPMSLE